MTDDDLEVEDEGDDDPADAAFLRELARVDDLPPPEQELEPGQRLDEFRIVARLGQGSMGTVYEAEDETLGRRVAIKVMRRASDDARRRFVQEARANAAVAHPNLVTIHAAGEADGRAFLVMEHVRGRTLRGTRPSPREALRIAIEIARGLAAVHAAGIVHRDLKPDNVMLAERGEVKVLDFGIAKWLAAGTDAAMMTGTGAVVGTPSYMSPEQARGEPIDARSDVYSFGVLAYELVAGARPAIAPAPIEPAGLDRVLRRCLAVDPAARYASAGELVAALEGVTFARRPRRAWTAVTVVVALAVVVAMGWRLVHRPASEQGGAFLARPGTHAANPQALAAYTGALQSLHDGMFFDAVRGLEHAVALDPSFAAAHLRLGLMKRFFHSQDEARASFAIAVQQRAQLDDHDRALLEAAEPSVQREPYDYAESARRLEAALERFPDDLELMYWLASDDSELGKHEQLIALTDRMLVLDPTASVVLSARTVTDLYLGRFREARESAIECRRRAPTQGACAFELSKVLDDQGGCDELETALRAWMIASPDEALAPRKLAELLLATDRPEPAVREVLAEARARLPEAQRADADRDDTLLFARTTGDFVTLERLLGASDPANARAALARIDLYLETGRDAEALGVAQEYERRTAAAPIQHGTSDASLFNDPTGAMLAMLARGGAISAAEYQRRRDAWVHELDSHVGGIYRRQIWAHAYAEPVVTAAEARDAVAVLPRFEPLAPYYWFFVYGAIGRTFALGGRPADALPYLERATHRCFDRDPRDFLALGIAKQALGDRDAACAAYRTVVRRWEHATARSLTLERARDAIAALGCR